MTPNYPPPRPLPTPPIRPARPTTANPEQLRIANRRKQANLSVGICAGLLFALAFYLMQGAGLFGVIVLAFVALLLGGGFLLFRAIYQVGAERPTYQVMPQPITAIQPGWYVDPHGITRWHDGNNWTASTAPTPPATR